MNFMNFKSDNANFMKISLLKKFFGENIRFEPIQIIIIKNLEIVDQNLRKYFCLKNIFAPKYF